MPRAFHERGVLRNLYTDVWSRGALGRLRSGPAALRSYASRVHHDLPGDRVVSFNLPTFWERLIWAPRSNSTESIFRSYMRMGEAFGRRVARRLRQAPLDPQTDAFFGYDNGSLEVLEPLAERGITTVVDQIDPGPLEEELVLQEAQKWPGWQATTGRIPQECYARLRREWEKASLVLVNSNWSKSALVQRGVPESKLIVIPLAYEPDAADPPVKCNPDRPLMVLWLGSVILRKGIQYLIEAAKILSGTTVRIVVAGPVGISEQAVASAPRNVEFIGRVTRSRAAEVYQAADVFVLPTISDGFAITQLEAMSQGLPVIATPNCGEVVTDGVDGLLIPAFSGARLAQAIARFDADRFLLPEMSAQALKKSRQFSLARFADGVEQGVTRLRQAPEAATVPRG